MANYPVTGAPAGTLAATAIAERPAQAPAAPSAAPAAPPSASAFLAGQTAAPEAEAGPRMPDTTVDPFYPPDGEQAEVDAAAEAAAAADPLAVNPASTGVAIESHLSAQGVDPTLAKFYGARFQKALAQPAPTAEQLATGRAEAHQAIVDYAGEHHATVLEMAQAELRELSRDYPDLPKLLERTGLGNDPHTIKSLFSRRLEKQMAARGYKLR